MKLFAILLAVFSMAFSAPKNCSHALGLANSEAAASSVETEMVAEDAHENMQGGDHIVHVRHDTAASTSGDHDKTHDGCTDDCTGGGNCDGCAMASSAIVALDQDGRALQVALGRNINAQYGIERAAKIDTPPPRGFEA